MKDERYRNYLRDLSVLLKERAREVKQEKDIPKSAEEKDYTIGCLMAFHEIISLMKQQAEAFGITQEELGLSDIDPDTELL